MKKIPLAAAGAVIIVLAAGGYWAAQRKADQALQDAIRSVRASLQPDGTLRYASAEASLFRRGAVLHDAVVEKPGLTATIGTLSAAGIAGDTIGRLTLDAVTIGAMDGSHLTVSHAAIADLTLPGMQSGQTPPPDAVRFSKLEADGIASANPDAPAAAAAALPVLRAGMIRIDGYGLHQPSAITSEGLSASIPDAGGPIQVSFDRAAVSGAGLADAIRAQRLHIQPDAATADISLDVAGLSLRQGGMAFSCTRFRSRQGHPADGAAALEMTADGFDIRSPALTTGRAKNLGYDRLSGDYTLESVYATADKILTIQSFRLAIKEAGILSLQGRLTNILMPANRQAAVFALMGSQLASLTVQWTDDGLTQRALNAAGPDTRPMALARLQAASATAGEQMRPVLAAVETFLRAPGTLTITLRPEQPVPLLGLFLQRAKPEQWLQDLKLTATATPKP